MAHTLSLLAESGEAQMALQSIEAPAPQSNAAWLVRVTLGLPPDAPLTAAHARRAALAALLCELRQADVGSFFATQVAIRIHDTEPATCLRDMAQMMAEGRITRRLPDGTEAIARIQTETSETALRDATLKLTRADPCMLFGSSRGGLLGTNVTLDTAPGFRRAMAAIGIVEHESEDAMAAALTVLKGTRIFAQNQNHKAVMESLNPISDPALRAKVLAMVLPSITHDQDVVRDALDVAISQVDPTGKSPAAMSATQQSLVRTLFKSALHAPTFNIEPAWVIEALILRRLGLDEADVARAKACDQLRAELAAHPDIRAARVLVRPADADLLDRLERLHTETEAIDWSAIDRLKSMRRDAFAGFQAESQNPLLRAWEYTLTALAERASGDHAMQNMQRLEMEVVEDQANNLAARIVKADRLHGAGVGSRGMRDIVQRLMASYRKVFAAGTSAGYDAAIKTGPSTDGQSVSGVWCLYDIQGIDDPDQWIKIEDDEAYGRLVQGMMMLAWKKAFGEEQDPAVAAMSRRLADELSERLLDGEVTELMARRSQQTMLGRNFKPWRLDGAGVPCNANEVVDERRPVTIVVKAPTNGTELVGRLGTYLRTLWNDPATGLKATASRHGDMAAVSASCFDAHVFSLVPGTPAFARLLDDPRDFKTALAGHVALERDKWAQTRAGTWLRTRDDVAEQAVRLLGDETPNAMIDMIWKAISAHPTMDAFCDQVIKFYTRVSKDRLPVIEAALARHVVMHLVPPVAAAELEASLGRIAKALAVPSDQASSVVRTAQGALNQIDRRWACMTDIRRAMAASMRDHGLDDTEATQHNVSRALRQPAGLVFADTNWGDAAHRIKLALVVHPFTGVPEVWEINDDNSRAHLADQAMYVLRSWQVTT